MTFSDVPSCIEQSAVQRLVRIGIDLGGTKIEGIVLDGSRALARLRVDTPRDDYEATVQAVVALVHALDVRAGAALGLPAGGRGSVGVGIPGTMSPATGLVKNANSVWLIGRPLAADLERRLDRRVRIANDANCFAVSEAADGAGAGAGVVFGAILGTGTGAGIVVGGEVLVGQNAIAGEWGHNPLPWPADEERPGPRCYCGRHGCIETFLSGPGLQADYARGSGRRRTPAEIVALSEAGDPDASASLDRYAHRLARGLASVINVLDPDVIVLGGGMSNIGRLYDEVPRLWGPYVFSDRVTTRLVKARHGDSSGVRGAAWLWPGDVM
ncbi:MAG: transcriptional regulator [Acidobacteria bacterium RIFCSPLOWO2_02_FULL_68_18]|nr:MAG: transcriptional regulator [Acidobacteria bacterium RIFCSPLOWO2_02_FULL_68_18]OFW51314.1 MAG: transcriptional regulator [Acidobacteria bacterium RIFCSPLOWO2_12_FULL_68_19]